MAWQGSGQGREGSCLRNPGNIHNSALRWGSSKLHDTCMTCALVAEFTLTWKSFWDCSGLCSSGGQGALNTASLALGKEFIPLPIRKEILFILRRCAHLQESCQGLSGFLAAN